MRACAVILNLNSCFFQYTMTVCSTDRCALTMPVLVDRDTRYRGTKRPTTTTKLTSSGQAPHTTHTVFISSALARPTDIQLGA